VQSGHREVHDGDCLFAGNAFKTVQKLIQSLARGQRIEKVSDWDARAVEAWGAADAIGVDPDEAKKGWPG